MQVKRAVEEREEGDNEDKEKTDRRLSRARERENAKAKKERGQEGENAKAKKKIFERYEP